MKNLTTQDSLKIIQTVIDQRRQQYEQNGIFLLFWGVLIVIAGVMQYIMIRLGNAEQSGLAWLFTMVPGAVITFISKYITESKKAKANKSTDLFGWLWALAGFLALATGFLFGNKFGMGFTAVIYLPFCMAAMASALSLKNYLWISLTILSTIIAYCSIFIPWGYHPLIASLISLFLFLIPGIQLFIHHKKRNHV